MSDNRKCLVFTQKLFVGETKFGEQHLVIYSTFRWLIWLKKDLIVFSSSLFRSLHCPFCCECKLKWQTVKWYICLFIFGYGIFQCDWFGWSRREKEREFCQKKRYKRQRRQQNTVHNLQWNGIQRPQTVVIAFLKCPDPPVM